MKNTLNQIYDLGHFLQWYNKQAFSEVAMFKTLIHKCKKNVKLSDYFFVNIEEQFIMREIKYSQLKKWLENIQNQLNGARIKYKIV